MLYEILIMVFVNGQILYQQNFIDNNFVDSQGWVVNNVLQSIGYCNQTKMFGGQGIFGKNTVITKFLTLPPHYAIMITLEFWKIDSWDDEYFYIYIDQNQIYSKMYGRSTTNINLCGLQSGAVWREEITEISLTQDHSFKSLFILMTTNLAGTEDDWWGIKNFKLYIYQCSPGCLSCTKIDQSIECHIWILQYQSLFNVEIDQFEMEGWTILEGEQTKSVCSSIPMLRGFVKNGQKSKIIKSINLPVHCQVKIKFRYIFIDKWNSESAQLYVNNQLLWAYSYESVKNGVILCGNDFTETILGQEISMPHKQQLLNMEFTATMKNSLTNLSFGIRDIEVFINCPYGFPLDSDCGEICGNGQIEKAEQCDDGNINPFDGCFNCQYSCVEGCSNCIKGICFECQDGWTFDEFQCNPISEDRIINNQDQYDIEQQYCIDNCSLCIKGNCQECDNGYHQINNQCLTICGDGILAGNEMCELDEQDCQNCQFICSKNCDFCIKGKCHQCIIGYNFNQIDQYCQSICGNGILSDDEECDDFNTENGDGCSSKCEIEQNYICKNFENSFTECNFEKYPKFLLKYLKFYQQYQYVSIYFDQLVKKNNQNLFSTKISMSLIGLNEIPYEINLIPIQEPFEIVTAVEYQVEIIINATLSQPPILKVILEDQLYNQNDAPLINQINQIKLNHPQYLDDQQKQNAIYLKEVAKYTMISMGGSTIIILVLYGSLFIQQILDILQQQSYLRFINVIFPLNLFIYFESSNLISLEPILDKIKFNNVFQQFMIDQYLESKGKLLFYEINAYILNNIQTQIFLIFVLLITYYSNYLAIYLIRKLNYQHLFYFGIKFANKLIKALKNMKKFKRNFETQAFQDFLNANSWDLIFMSFLQINSNTNNIITNLISYLILYTTLILSSTIFSRKSFPKKYKHKLWKSKSNDIKLLKKVLFISVLVIFQQNQKLQIMLLTFICQIYLIYLSIVNPFENIIDKINTMTMEISTFIFCFSSALYWNDFTNKLSYSIQVQFAWFQIGMLLSCLFINVVLQLRIIFLEIKKIIIKKFYKINTQQNQNYMKTTPFLNP